LAISRVTKNFLAWFERTRHFTSWKGLVCISRRRILAVLVDLLADRVADRVLARMPQADPSTPPPVPAKPLPILLTLEQTAQQLNISVSTVKRMIADEALPAVKLGTEPQPKKRDLRAFAFPHPSSWNSSKGRAAA
jgi:excisionase family DNA binding protein